MTEPASRPRRITRVELTRVVAPTPDQWRDLAWWLVLIAAGLALTAWAVRSGAMLGTASAPFLGAYRLQLAPTSLLAPAVAVAVLAAAAAGWFERARWGLVLASSYLAGLAWSLSLAVVDGAAGLTRSLSNPDNYLSDLNAIGDAPLRYLRHFTQDAAVHSVAARGHPPGPALLLWALERVGLHRVGLALFITAVGTLTIPLVLAAVRGVCGETPARRYATVLILAPYAIWVAVSEDVFTSVLGAAMVAAGVRASDRQRGGPRAGAWALAAGLLLGLASLFSYAAPWLGLSVVFLYFARRRPFLNIATGVGALLPILLADRLGFGWLEGLGTAHHDYLVRIEPYRSVWWWSAISLVALLLAAGPALLASARKLRNTPGWPFLVGAACAVLFSVLAGLARGGVEHAWLAFFPWLTIAAVAPNRQAGPDVPVPALLAAFGALTAIIVEAVLATPW